MAAITNILRWIGAYLALHYWVIFLAHGAEAGSLFMLAGMLAFWPAAGKLLASVTPMRLRGHELVAARGVLAIAVGSALCLVGYKLAEEYLTHLA